ncbi:MAG TPA: D-glycerate dehydrogenase [Candidatus Acidoferrum sp.]|nr:D-glycerate dehydrogenase [Candidatus Acidoferrum sp.]
MAKAKVFSTHPLFDEARVILGEHCDVEYWAKPERPSREEIAARIKEKDGLISLLTDRINEDLLLAAPKLRIVANVAVGFDNLDVPACTRHSVIATNTPGVLDETTADFTWTLLLAVARRLVEADTYTRNGNWKGWNLDQMCGTDVWGKTLGIVGFGRIGRAVARRAAGFKMRILYNATKRAPVDVEKELGAEYRELNALLAESDFVTLHVPLNSETRGLLDVPKFFRMKPTAFVINTSRGPVIDEAALVHALEAKKIAGAALDVFEQEPFIHPGLKRSNVVMAPHMGSASVETRSKMAAMAAHNVAALFRGHRPPNMLNPEVFQKS